MVVAAAKLDQSVAQVVQVLGAPHPERLLFEGGEETFDASVALRLADKRCRGFQAQEAGLRLEVVAHVVAAVIVTKPQAGPLPRRRKNQTARGLPRGSARVSNRWARLTTLMPMQLAVR